MDVPLGLGICHNVELDSAIFATTNAIDSISNMDSYEPYKAIITAFVLLKSSLC